MQRQSNESTLEFVLNYHTGIEPAIMWSQDIRSVGILVLAFIEHMHANHTALKIRQRCALLSQESSVAPVLKEHIATIVNPKAK